MNATRQALRRVVSAAPATARGMAGTATGPKTPPYKHLRGVVEQHTSPFELSQVDTLVANFGRKFKHETVDNIPDLLPALILLGITAGYTKYHNDKNRAAELF